jgi:hypothetical protein
VCSGPGKIWLSSSNSSTAGGELRGEVDAIQSSVVRLTDVCWKDLLSDSSRFGDVRQRIRTKLCVNNIPDIPDGIEDEATTTDREEGAGPESSGYCEDGEETVRTGLVKQQGYKQYFSPLRGFCGTGDSVGLDIFKVRK